MKSWMLALSLIAVMGFTGLANAKGTKGAKKDKGIKGTIVSVTGTSFTMTLGGGKKGANAGTTVTVDTANATVTGTLAAGAKVSVVGSQSGDKITASKVTIAKSKGKKKKNA